MNPNTLYSNSQIITVNGQELRITTTVEMINQEPVILTAAKEDKVPSFLFVEETDASEDDTEIGAWDFDNNYGDDDDDDDDCDGCPSYNECHGIQDVKEEVSSAQPQYDFSSLAELLSFLSKEPEVVTAKTEEVKLVPHRKTLYVEE